MLPSSTQAAAVIFPSLCVGERQSEGSFEKQEGLCAFVCVCVTLHLISLLLSFLLLVWLPGVFVCALVSMCTQHIHLPRYQPSFMCVECHKHTGTCCSFGLELHRSAAPH